jgi:hypothetical protein
MKFALIDGKKTEATKGAKGLCPSCGSELVAKCGEVKVNHWAHKGSRTCDPWWENETDWHRSWKGQFPIDWQEVIHFDENGEKHIADVKTENAWVLEFQHSYLNPEERRAREAFYTKLVWVVDGLRRKRDKPQFQKVIEESTVVSKKPFILRVSFPEECRLLKEWLYCSAPVFFDFQEPNELKHSVLWLLFPKISNGEAYLSHFSRNEFIKYHHDERFDEMVKNTILPIRDILASNKRNDRSSRLYNRSNRLSGFERYMANKRRKKRRF